MNFPSDLKYTRDHEWIRVDGDVATLGITDFAQSELGDIVFVEMPELGSAVTKDTVFGTVEAVKTVADIISPVSGEVIEINEGLDGEPESVNDDPYGAGWIIRIKMSTAAEADALMDAKAYEEFVG